MDTPAFVHPDMTNIEKQLVEKAVDVQANAYAPYSGFKVGAALISDDGAIYTGANVENANYTLGICAERNALQDMAADGKRRFDTLVIYTEADDPTPSCGACRQVAQEFAGGRLHDRNGRP